LPQAIGTVSDSKWGFIDRTGKFVIAPQFDYVAPFEDGISKVGFIDGQRELYIDETGRSLFPAHTVLGSFDDHGLAMTADYAGFHNGYDVYTYNFVNRNGELVSDVPLAGAGEFTEGYAAANMGGKSKRMWGAPRGGKWGFIDTGGNWVIDSTFSYALPFSDGYAGVAVGGVSSPDDPDGASIFPRGAKWGFIDKTGAVVIKPQFQEVGSFSNGLAPAKSNNKWGLIDKSGAFVIKPQFQEIQPFSNGAAPAKRNNKWGLIDRTGKFIAQPTYIKLRRIQNDMYVFPADPDYNQYGILTKTGRVIGSNFTSVGQDFSEGLLTVGWKDSGAFLNAKGQFILRRTGVRYGDFVSGFAGYYSLKNRLAGFIDRNGKTITQPVYANYAPFSYGLALVVTRDAKGNEFDAYIDTTGRTIWKSKIPR